MSKKILFMNSAKLTAISLGVLLAIFCTIGMSFTPAEEGDNMGNPNDSTYVTGPRRSHWTTSGECGSTNYHNNKDYGKVIITVKNATGGTVSASGNNSTSSTANNNSTSVTVTWNCGYSDSNNHTDLTVKHTNKITFTANKTTGYNFEGWYSDAACTQLVKSDLSYSEDFVIGHDSWGIAQNTEYESSGSAQTWNRYAKFVEIEPVDLTFIAPGAGGSYTVTINGSSSTVTSANVVKTGITTEVALVATPASGYVFAGWYQIDGEGNVSDLSASTPYNKTFAKSVSVGARFISTSTPKFKNKDTGTEYYGLRQAAIAASSGQVIYPVADCTVDGSDLVIGESYTIPVGVILLIPYDASNTLKTTDPSHSYAAPGTPTKYRKLTLASGVNIFVNGSVSVGAISQGNQPYGGCVYGTYGQIDLESGSAITFNSGANLYCWGYITGEGEITAKSGSKIYEDFQIACWRGGSAASSIAGNSKKVFPLAQYYIQNIEAKIHLEAGVSEYVWTAVSISSKAIRPNSIIQLVGSSNGLFQISSGTLTRWYNATDDRQMYELEGNMTLGSVSMTFSYSIITAEINSDDYVLPLTNNMDITIKSGTMSCNKKIAILPGAKITIFKGANVSFGSSSELYVYDKDEWPSDGASAFNYNNVAFKPVNYTATPITNVRTYSNMNDAIMIVNGTFTTASGHFYTTSGKANICATESGGKIVFTKAPASSTPAAGSKDYTYQATQSGTDISYTSIPMTPAQLHNADDSYTATAGSAAGTVFTYCCGEWSKQDGCSGSTYTVTWKSEDGSSILRTQTFYDCEDPVYSGSPLTKPNDSEYCNYTIDGWSSTPGGDVLSTPLPRETATYYAHLGGNPTVASVTVGSKTKYYATLAAAFASANLTDASTITILKDISGVTTGLSYIRASGTCTLDLNNHTVSGAVPYTSDKIIGGLIVINASGANFTITDNSGAKNGRIENIKAQNQVTYGVLLSVGTLNVSAGTIHVENNGVYNNSNYASLGARAIHQAANTTLNISGGRIESFAGRNAYGILQDANATTTTTLTMTGGDIYVEAPAYAYGVSAKNVFNFSNGTITVRLNTSTVNSNTSDTNADRINHRYGYGIMMTGAANATASSNIFSTLNMTGGKVYSYNDNIKTTTQLHTYGIYFNGSSTNVAVGGSAAADGTYSQKWSAKGTISNAEIYVENTGRTAYGVFVVGSYNSKDNKSHVVKISNTKITTYASYDAIGVYANASIGTTSTSSTRNLAAMYHADIELNNCEVKAETTSSVNAYAIYGISTSNTIYADQTEYDTSNKADIAQTRFTGEYATASKITINGGTYSAKSAAYNAFAIYTSVRSITTYGTDTKVYANKTPGGHKKDSVTLVINGGTFNATSTTYQAYGVHSGGKTTIDDATFNVVAGSYYAYGLYVPSGKLTATNVLVNDTAKGRVKSSDNNAYAYGVQAHCGIPSGNTAQTGFAYAGEVELNNCTIKAVASTYQNARGIFVNATSKLHNWAQFHNDSVTGNGSGTKWSTDNYNQYKQVFPCTIEGRDSVWVGIAAKVTVNGGTYTVRTKTTTAYGAFVNRALKYSYTKPNTILEEYQGQLEINNATFDVQTEGTTTAEGVRSYGQTTITGGSFTVKPKSTTAYGLKVYSGKTTVNGNPTFNVTATKIAYGIMAGGGDIPADKTGDTYNGEVEVNGGTFNVTTTSDTLACGVRVYAGSRPITSTAAGYYAGNYASAGKAIINAGVFNVTSKKTIAYGIDIRPAVSQSGATGYETATATPVCTVNGGTFTATAASDAAHGAYVSNGVTLTVTDGTFKGKLTAVGAEKYAVGAYIAAGGGLNATGGTFEAEAANEGLSAKQKAYACGLYSPDGTATISASNATFKGELKSTYLTNGGEATWSGGAYGVYARTTSPLSLNNCTITGNSAYQGGFGLRFANTPAEVRNCTVDVTTTKAYNYGLFVGGATCDVKLYDCSFTCTSGTTYAYGIYAYNGATYAENCTIAATVQRTGASSAADSYLYGVLVATGKTATLKDCSITATGSGKYSNNGYGVYVDGTANLDNCDVAVSNINSGAYALYNTSNTTLLNVASGKYKATATSGAASTNGTAAAAKQTLNGGYYSHNTNLSKYVTTPYQVLTLPTTHAEYANGYRYEVAEAYTLEWVTDGDVLTGDYTSGTVKVGTTLVAPNTPAKTGYTFDGWDNGYSGIMPAANTTYTATWACMSPTISSITSEGGKGDFCSGEIMTLTVNGSNIAADATYQWKKNNENIAGATNATYTKTMTREDAGTYTCTVTNGSCSTTSSGYDVKVWTLYHNVSGSFDHGNLTFSSTGIGTITLTLAAGETYEFKLNNNMPSGNWFGNTGTITTTIEDGSAWIFGSSISSNCSITAGTGGSYVFKVNYSDSGNPKVSVTYPMANQPSGRKIYFDKSVIDNWGDNIYYRIGHKTYSQSSNSWTLVPGTDNFYQYTTTQFDGFEAWQIANNKSQDNGSTSIYTVNGSNAITRATNFQKYAVDASGVTIVPYSFNNTENGCNYWNVSKTDGMLTHDVTITTPMNGTITISNADQSLSETTNTAGIPHRTILTITAIPNAGYKCTSLRVNGAAFTSGDTYILAADATIAATFEADETGDYLDIVDATPTSLTINATTLTTSLWPYTINGTKYKRTASGDGVQCAADRTITISHSLDKDAELVITVLDKNSTLVSSHSYTIPHVYETGGSLTGTDANSIVFVHSGTLTVSGEVSAKAIYVSAGAELKVKGTLNVTKLVLRTSPWAAAILTNNGTINATYTYYSRIVPDNAQYYQFGIPAASSTSTMKLSDGSTPSTSTWQIMRYSEYKRATEGASTSGTNWVALEGETIAGGQGYEMYSSSKFYREFYFPITISEGEEVAVQRTGDNASNSGWNIVVSPKMGVFSNAQAPEGITISVLQPDGNYVQENPSVINPAMPFSYQAPGNGKLVFSGSSVEFEANQASPSPRHRVAAAEERVRIQWMHLDVKDANGEGDQTSIYSHPTRYERTYKTGIDVAKQSLTASRAVLYSSHAYGEMAFAGVADSLLEQGVALTVYSPSEQELMISMRENDWLNRMEHVWLIDNETGMRVDLLESDYAFRVPEGTTRGRLFIQGQFKAPNVITDIDPASDSSLKGRDVRKVMIDQKIYIIVGERMYDATGKLVLDK